MKEPMRVLHVLGSLNLGGAESRIMDLYREIDKSKVQFDFAIHSAKECFFEKEVMEMGGRIYRLPSFKLYNFFQYKKAWKQFFKEHHEFQAVHGHMTSTASIYLPLAKKAGVAMTIAHARSAGVDSGIKGIITKWIRKPLKRRADYCIACSELAGEAVFGKKAVRAGRVKVLPNTIRALQYQYNEQTRNQIRESLNIKDEFVIGHVGRFHPCKNHEFLLEVFKAFLERTPNAILLLLGAGERMDTIREMAKEAGMEDKVRFLGNKENINEYYQAFDAFVFPSFYEGMPGSVVEAQAAGIPCLVSDRVTAEVKFTDLVTFYPLEQSAKEWAAWIYKEAMQQHKRDRYEETVQAGFDAKGQAAYLEEFYKGRPTLLLISPMLGQGGFEKVCIATARLFKQEYDVTIVIFSKKGMLYDIDDLKVVDLNVPSSPGIVHKIWNVYKRVRGLQKFKKQIGFDVAYSFGPTANLVNALSGGKGEVWVGLRSYMDLESKRNLDVYCKRADRIVCCSKLIEQGVKERYLNKKVTTLYNPYDLIKIHLQSQAEPTDFPYQEGDKIVVSMGREDDVKGFWHLLKSFRMVREKVVNAKLMIIGDGTFEEYRKLAEDLKVQEDVFFTGVQKNPYPYLKKADVYVLSSLNEGFPNALVEAMALGIPVIAANCPSGPAEILQQKYKELSLEESMKADYGILVPQFNRKKNLSAVVFENEEKILAETIALLLTDDKLHAFYADKSRCRASEYSIDTYAEQFREMVQERNQK